MYIITGGTGHTGSVVAQSLLSQGHQVTIVSRDNEERASWQNRGALFAVADIHNDAKLNQLFKQGQRAFLLNPPAPPASDTDKEETETVRCLLKALDNSGLEKVVAQSSYGAQSGEKLGDLSVLYALEQGLKAQTIPAVIMRAAYLMSNWAGHLASIKETGILTSMMPETLQLPMVAPNDLGLEAARQLTAPSEKGAKTIHVEGPARYSAKDVAIAFTNALHRSVKVMVIPREKWIEYFRQQGFSERAAESYARMNQICVDGELHPPSDPVRGTTTLQTYVDALVDRGIPK